MGINDKVAHFVEALRSQLSNRIMVGFAALSKNVGAAVSVELFENTIWIKLQYNADVHVITIPVPFVVDGVELIEIGDVRRATTKYFHKPTDRLMTFVDAMFEIMLGNPNSIIPDSFGRKKNNILQALRYGYNNNNLGITVHTVQKHINYVVNRLPVFKTLMNAWAVNNRVEILDPDFFAITDPEEKHKYQINKNILYYDRFGWTSLGLSDGSMASDNYMLSVDLRKLTPFGLQLHNPHRNLYSTLGTMGDEKPLIKTQTMAELEKEGLSRKGWNLFTAFVDIPDVWEDQIMVDISHANKSVTYTKNYTCVGKVQVLVGQSIKCGDILYTNPANENKIFDIECDKAEVISSEKRIINLQGAEKLATHIVVQYKRFLKDGTKITNMSANKGVIRLCELGYAINPKTGEKQQIDVIVSSKAVLKRKNYSQVVEALFNTLNDSTPTIYSDHASASTSRLETSLVEKGYNADGTWLCKTYAGDLKCVCGNVFWGVTHDADDTIWVNNTTKVLNSRNIRNSGLKFSIIEFRALETRYGQNNAIEKEILMYAQGIDDVTEQINVLRSKIGNYVYSGPTIPWSSINPIITKEGTLFKYEDLTNTIADPDIRKEGFFIKLPVVYHILLDKENNVLFEGFPNAVEGTINNVEINAHITIDKIYVPWYNLRRCWKHESGDYGVSDISAAINTIIVACQRYEKDKNSSQALTAVYSAIHTYFNIIKCKLNTKKGEISTLGLSVRYPFSVKAVATLSNEIPANTVQIHNSMAKYLNVKEGDVVLVERFPCLGFMSLRPQKVTITTEDSCRYTIRASGNSLGSLSLDFDGDVLYIASFHSPEAVEMLNQEWDKPNPFCDAQIKRFNAKMGAPRTKEMTLQDYNINSFKPLTTEMHAKIVGSLVGVKAYTGPVVALAYNILRIMENSAHRNNPEVNCLVEVFVDTVANSVFSLKHGKESLHKIVAKAICLADIETLVSKGFDRNVSTIVCNTIREKAKKLNVIDLEVHYNNSIKYKRSNIINLIVRNENKLYFTSRANLDTTKLLHNLSTYDVVDVPSGMFNKIMSKKYQVEETPLEAFENKKLVSTLKLGTNTGVTTLLKVVDKIFNSTKTCSNT